MKKKLLSIVIPVYNEEKRIEVALNQVIAFTPKDWDKELIIVNDGSKDNSLEIIKKVKEKQKGSKITVHSYLNNAGKGHAIKQGISKANGEFILIQDADLEYNPNDIPTMLCETKDCDAVYGSRFMGTVKGISKTHLIGNKFLSTLTSILYGQKITDMETGYKLIRTDLLQELNLASDDFQIEPEITIKLLKKKIKIKEVPISYTAREKLEKKISVNDGIKAFWYLVRNRVR